MKCQCGHEKWEHAEMDFGNHEAHHVPPDTRCNAEGCPCLKFEQKEERA